MHSFVPSEANNGKVKTIVVLKTMVEEERGGNFNFPKSSILNPKDGKI
jgi:hypothetical protein